MFNADNIYVNVCLQQYKIAKTLGLISSESNFIPIVYLVLTSVGTVFSVYFSVRVRILSTDTSYSVINILEGIDQHIFTFALLFAMKNKNTWESFLKLLKHISHRTKASTSGTLSALIFLLTHIIFLVFIAGENYLDTLESASVLEMLVGNLDRLNYYLKFFTVIFMICAANVASAGFSHIGDLLQHKVKEMILNNSQKVTGELTETDRLFGKCSEYVAQINNIFGWPMVSIFIFAIIRILGNINLILFQSKNGSFQYRLLSRYGMDMIFVVYITWDVMTCDRIKKKCLRVISCFYALQRKMVNSPLKDDLLTMAQCARYQNPQISAAEFFDVDRSLLVLMFSTLTTYLIVCIQFNMYV